MDLVTTSRRFQVVIPRDIRRKAGLKAGQKLSVELSEDGTILLHPLPENLIDSLAGSCRHLGGHPVAELRKERRREHV